MIGPDELTSLLVEVDSLSPKEVEALGRRLYTELYLLDGASGLIQAHDGEHVLFLAGTFDHAFFSSSDRARHPAWKDRLAPERVARIRWIKELVGGNVSPSACWHIPGSRGSGRGSRREYAILGPYYVVWLAARPDGGYRFDTAYPAMAEDLSRYARDGKRIWSRK